MNTLRKEGIHTAESVRPDTRPSLQTSAVRMVTVELGGFSENSGTKETKNKTKTTTTKHLNPKNQNQNQEQMRRLGVRGC